MQLPVRKESLPVAGALFLAALAGGTVAVVGAALVGTGEHTTTVREIVEQEWPELVCRLPPKERKPL